MGLIIGTNSISSGGRKPLIVEELPDSGKSGIIYLVRNELDSEGDLYDEYLYVNGSFEKIGVTHIDLKTVNGESILGNGDITIKAYHTFKNNWVTNSTTEAFCTNIVNDDSAVTGMIYLGQLSCSDLPGGLIQGEAVVEIISNGANGKIVHITLFSADTSPYKWEYNRARINGNYVSTGWKAYLIEITNSNKLPASYISGLSAVATSNSYNDLDDKPNSENKVLIVAIDNTILTLTAEVDKYYRIDVPVETLAITLPTVTDATSVKSIVFYMTGGTTPAITFTSTHNVYYSNGFGIESGKTYEVNALYNGVAWVVASVEIVTSNS